ncbi:MAG: hypothetical protein JRD88_03195 [Deltaproteobacteria bacterium]|jgi:hypothetical protein|nr:hypothetical protein [Deltaproteobacteria bacterium]
MANDPKTISPLFISQFEVDSRLPFQRHLNRLEVEIGKEDYSHLKRVELLKEEPSEEAFTGMQEITDRLFKTTQNNYNRRLLQDLEARIYLAEDDYSVYYRLPDRCFRFEPVWRTKVLQRFFNTIPRADSGWIACDRTLPGFETRFLPDEAGGVCLLRHHDACERQNRAVITASHGPYDPHTLEVALYLLRSGKGGSAAINLGFSGREPLNDQCLLKLAAWGIPLNPSNIDVIYPYVDATGHPYCYKLEENLPGYLECLDLGAFDLVIDVHGCVGTFPEDKRVIIGLGGLPPYHRLEDFGTFTAKENVLLLLPDQNFGRGLTLLRELSSEMYVQLCAGTHQCFNFALLGGMQLLGSQINPKDDVQSLLDGEERTYLPEENLRWLPGAGANALQRIAVKRSNPSACCLHVEIPTAVRRKIALSLHALEIGDSLDASSL